MLAPGSADAIEHNLEELRFAIENRQYAEAQRLLDEQRGIFLALDIRDAETREQLNRAGDLAAWALTLARVHHAHAERAFASLLKLKQLDAGYLPSPVCSAELVSVRG